MVEDHHAGAARPRHPGDGAARRAGDDVPKRHDAGVLQGGHGKRDGAAHLLRLGAGPGRASRLARGTPGEPGFPR
jgi:hypothetical protein